MYFSVVKWSFRRMIALIDLMLVRAFKMIIFAMMFIKIGKMFRIMMSIRFMIFISNVMCSIRVPWLMAASMLMINKYSSALIVRFF